MLGAAESRPWDLAGLALRARDAWAVEGLATAREGRDDASETEAGAGEKRAEARGEEALSGGRLAPPAGLLTRLLRRSAR